MPADQNSSENSDLWTVQRVLDWTVTYLTQAGSDSPRLDAEILLSHARNCKRVQLYTQFQNELTEAERTTMRALVKRRAKHEPVAYLVGHREFFSLRFAVSPDVLIPRPETETLVVELIEAAREMPEPRILDVGTGSGCMAIAAAVHLPTARVTAIDISETALSCAQRNAEYHRVADRVSFLLGDLFSPISHEEHFDFVISNPPYITTTEWESLPESVRNHEPPTALLAGEDGLDVIRRLMAAAPDFLKPGGRLLLELDPAQVAATVEIMQAVGRFADIAVVRDLNRQERAVWGSVRD